jgi:hypothetical protein
MKKVLEMERKSYFNVQLFGLVVESRNNLDKKRTNGDPSLRSIIEMRLANEKEQSAIPSCKIQLGEYTLYAI